MVAATFSDIYRHNGWNGIESRSGPGSGSMATRRTAESLLFLVDALGVTSVLDVGCGDGFWMPDLPGYIGIDVAPEALALLHERHPERGHMLATGMPFPESDLVFSRDVMQHLSLADGVSLLDYMQAAAQSWLLASTYLGTVNHDVPTGGFCEPDLMTSPYSLGPPLLLVPDGWDWVTGDTVRDHRKFLGLWRAP